MRRSWTARRNTFSSSQPTDHSLISLLRSSNRDSVQSLVSRAFRTPTPTFPVRFSPSPKRLFLTDTPSPDNLLPAIHTLLKGKHSPKAREIATYKPPDVKYVTLMSDLEEAKKEMTTYFKDLESLKQYVNEVKGNIDRKKRQNRRLVRRIFRGEEFLEVRKRLDR